MKFAVEIAAPEPGEYAPYFQSYLDLVGREPIDKVLDSQPRILSGFMADVPEAIAETVHPPYAWTIKQVVGHMNDTEKIFGCRAHCIACAEIQPLPGFDQDSYVQHSDFGQLPLTQLVSEFAAIRTVNLMLFQRLSVAGWRRSGICDNKVISVRAIARLLAGHFNHHFNIIRKRMA